MNVVSPAPAAMKRGPGDDRADAPALHHGRGKRPHEAKEERLTETAREIVARDQPNSSSSGTISKPGVERVPDAARRVTKVTAKTTQA